MKETKYQKDNIPSKLTDELLNRIGYNPDDYFSLVNKFNPDVLKWYMNLVFAVGFDIGTKQNVRHGMKKVVAFNGIEEKRFDSIRDAGRFFHVNHANIVRAIRLEQRSRGYFWKYA